MKPDDDLPPASTAVTLGSIVTTHPQAAAFFENLGLDYCCGGGQTLEEACRDRGLDAATVRAALAALEALEALGSTTPAREHDVAGLSATELSEHIVSAHHRPLGPQMDRIDELLVKVTGAHGAHDPGVYALQQRFATLRSELSEHMQLEEDELFPACPELESGDGEARPSQELLSHLEHTHSDTGAALAELRELGNGYRPESAHCATHRVLLSELTDFERDLHQHIHEENNILFPAVRGLLAD